MQYTAREERIISLVTFINLFYYLRISYIY